MSDEEVILWSELKLLRPQGLHFRRQVPVGPYFADFGCLKAKVLIEVDGEQHFHGVHVRMDMERDMRTNALGYVTLRYTTAEIRRELNAVVADIFHRTLARLPTEGRRS